jgi:hypothetical protein
MLRDMREVWSAFNAARRAQVEAEVQAARERHAAVTEYWSRHRTLVKKRWENRTGRRGETTVADIPEVAAQWHPDNPLSPEKVSATAQQRSAPSPYLWHCPLGLGHTPWPAWPKDRIQKGSGCPSCQKLVKLSDIPTLAEQYRGPLQPRGNYLRGERRGAVGLPDLGARPSHGGTGTVPSTSSRRWSKTGASKGTAA